MLNLFLYHIFYFYGLVTYEGHFVKRFEVLIVIIDSWFLKIFQNSIPVGKSKFKFDSKGTRPM